MSRLTFRASEVQSNEQGLALANALLSVANELATPEHPPQASANREGRFEVALSVGPMSSAQIEGFVRQCIDISCRFSQSFTLSVAFDDSGTVALRPRFDGHPLLALGQEHVITVRPGEEKTLAVYCNTLLSAP